MNALRIVANIYGVFYALFAVAGVIWTTGYLLHRPRSPHARPTAPSGGGAAGNSARPPLLPHVGSLPASRSSSGGELDNEEGEAPR
jgi:hypothetical protein